MLYTQLLFTGETFKQKWSQCCYNCIIFDPKIWFFSFDLSDPNYKEELTRFTKPSGHGDPIVVIVMIPASTHVTGTIRVTCHTIGIRFTTISEIISYKNSKQLIIRCYILKSNRNTQNSSWQVNLVLCL